MDRGAELVGGREMVCHLGALIPVIDRISAGGRSCMWPPGRCVASRRHFGAGALSVPPGGALDEGGDRGLVEFPGADVAFPVARLRPIGRGEQSVVDAEHGLLESDSPALLSLVRPAVISTVRSGDRRCGAS